MTLHDFVKLMGYRYKYITIKTDINSFKFRSRINDGIAEFKDFLKTGYGAYEVTSFESPAYGHILINIRRNNNV